MTVSERSGHAFGETVNGSLEPMQPVFAQGCVSATLDSIAKSAGFPCPNHVKIDVDGLEHRIIAGAATLLQDARLKSVLVEINQNLDEHQHIIGVMRDAGFAYSEEQVRRSENPPGAVIQGMCNYIFKR